MDGPRAVISYVPCCGVCGLVPVGSRAAQTIYLMLAEKRPTRPGTVPYLDLGSETVYYWRISAGGTARRMGSLKRSEDDRIHLLHGADPGFSTESPVGERRILQVRQALDEILRSTPFRASAQCQRLLTYLVDHSLAGQYELLRERVIGVEVFGREPDYDAANDPVVRARVAEVRKRLAQYYLSAPSSPWPVRIEIPSGHYRARFDHAEPELLPSAPESREAEGEISEIESIAPAAPVSPPVVVAPPAAPASHPMGWLRPLFMLGCLVLVALAATLIFRSVSARRSDAFNQFWAPTMKNSMPVILYTGTNVIYRFTPEFLDRYRRAHHLPNDGPEFALNLNAAGPIEPQDLLASTNAYVTVGDVTAVTAITSMLAKRGKPYQLRYAGDISPGDVHSAPTVLIGAFNNPWTLSVTDPLRFVFAGGDMIRDKQTNRTWIVRVKPDRSTTDDYAIVSRLLSPDGRDTIMTAAGIGQYGTQAASEFLSNPAKIADFARTAPAGWAKKNLQIVMHIRVVDDAPGSVDIVSAYSW